MRIIIRQFLAVLLSLLLIFSSITTSYAASPAGWTVSGTVVNGAVATVTAIKGTGSSALKSVITHAPAAGKIGKEIIKGGGVLGVTYALSQILGAGVDYVMDSSNNTVKYKPAGGEFDSDSVLDAAGNPAGAGYYWVVNRNLKGYASPESACSDAPWNGILDRKVNPFRCTRGSKGWNVELLYRPDYPPAADPNDASSGVDAQGYKSIPAANLAQNVIANAQSGHAPSQELVALAAVSDADSGELDTQFNAAAVSDTDGTTPPDTTDPDTTVPVPPFDSSSILAAIQSLADIISAKFTNMTNALGITNTKLDNVVSAQQDTNQVVNDSIDRAIANNDLRVADIIAAIEAIEGNTLDGQVINDAIDRVIEAGVTDKSDIVAAIEAIEGNTLDGQVINDAVDRVIEASDMSAQSTQDVISQSTDKAITASEADTLKVTDAIEAQTEAIEAQKQATDAQNEWLKEPPAPLDPDTELDIDIPSVVPVDTDINFSGSCPANFEVHSSIFGNPIDITLFDTSKFCSFLSTFVKFPVYAASSLFALYILGGRKDV